MSVGTISRFSVVYVGLSHSLRNIDGITIYIAKQDKYIVLIDTNKTEQQQKQALKRELVHVFLKHAERNMNNEEKKREAEIKGNDLTDNQLNYLLSFADNIEHLPGCFDDQAHYYYSVS